MKITDKRPPVSPYESIQGLAATAAAGAGDALARWERSSLAALRARALYQGALDLGNIDQAAEWWGLYHLDKAQALVERVTFIGGRGQR